MKGCGPLPEGYEFLERFETTERGKCDLREFEVKGMIYNVEVGDEVVKFDLNAWDLESRESLYYEDIEVYLEKYSSEEVLSIQSVLPVTLRFSFSSGSKNIFAKEYSVSSVWLEKIVLGKEEILSALQDLYIVISGEDGYLADKYEKLPFVAKSINSEGKSVYTSVGLNAYSLYKPLVESILEKSSIRESVLNGLEESSLSEYLTMVEDFKKEELVSEEDAKSTGDSNSVLYPFGCILARDIIDSGNITKDESNLLVENYCDLEQLESLAKSMSPSNYAYTVTDFSGSINSERISLDAKVEDTDLSLLRLAFIGDFYASLDINNEKMVIDSSIVEKFDSLVIEELLKDQIPLRSTCVSAVASERILRDSDSNLSSVILNDVRAMFATDVKGVSSFADSDPYSIAMCMYSVKGEDSVRALYDSLLVKFLYLNFLEKDGTMAFWNDDLYHVESNAFFFNMLLEEYEK